MANELLLDTGALVSLLDRSQPRHQEFAEFFDSWTGPVVTTEAVLTESTHLLGRVTGGAVACLDFVLSGGALLVPATTNSIRRARDLMNRYGAPNSCDQLFDVGPITRSRRQTCA